MRIAILLASLALPGIAQTFPIAGVVVDAGSGSPMNRIRVTLTPAARAEDQRSVITAADGKFSFDVPKGKFRIVAEYRGFRQTFGQGGPGVGFGVAIFTGPDQDTSHLIFRWFALGAISGRVVDDRGEAVENAQVQLIGVSVVSGRKRRSTVAWASTNDLGEYRFGQRPGGTYFLVVTGQPWYTDYLQPLGDSVPGLRPPGEPQETHGEPAQSYAPTYYPGVNDPRGAEPVELAPGAEVRADFRLPLVPGVKVHVHCPHAPGLGFLVWLRSAGPAGVETFQRQTWLFGDDGDIAGVFPGHYLVTAEGQAGNTSQARAEIDVGASDVSVELTLTSPPRVSGVVTFPDPQRRPRRAVTVRLIDETTGNASASAIDGSGAFSIQNVPPGPRRVQISSADGFFAARIAAEGTALNGSVIQIAPGAQVHLTIVASGEAGALKGLVMNGDRPAAGVLVVLAPKQESDDPGQYRGYQTDSDGSFDYQNARAGDYVLFAIDRLDLEYANRKPCSPILHRESLSTSSLTKPRSRTFRYRSRFDRRTPTKGEER